MHVVHGHMCETDNSPRRKERACVVGVADLSYVQYPHSVLLFVY